MKRVTYTRDDAKTAKAGRKTSFKVSEMTLKDPNASEPLAIGFAEFKSLRDNLHHALTQMVSGLKTTLSTDSRDKQKIRRMIAASDALLQLLDQIPEEFEPSVVPSPKSTAQAIDLGQFASLLQMAGPTAAAEILAHFQSDLKKAHADILAASAGPNWPELRGQTHIIIALAGTAGANVLSQHAKTMNLLAQQPHPDITTFKTNLAQLLDSLDDLSQFIALQINETGKAL